MGLFLRSLRSNLTTTIGHGNQKPIEQFGFLPTLRLKPDTHILILMILNHTQSLLLFSPRDVFGFCFVLI